MEIHVINDLQWGSCAKRLFTEFYAKQWQPDVIITNGMPNSGGYDSNNVKWSTLPIGYKGIQMISPGSVININNLQKEMGQLPYGAHVLIHEHAGVVTPDDLSRDADRITVGSTMTGGAEAQKDKMDRNVDHPAVIRSYRSTTDFGGAEIVNTEQWLNVLSRCRKVLVLCAQGHGLSINWGFYPYCTSRNTSPAQAIADAGLPPQYVTKIIGCCRPYPIRVSNRYDGKGNMIGYSGPSYPEQTELVWSDIGVPEELTSVSKKVRRVFDFSHQQLEEAVAITGTTDLFMGFLNYLPTRAQKWFCEDVSNICPVTWVGVDKTISDIMFTREYGWDRSWINQD